MDYLTLLLLPFGVVIGWLLGQWPGNRKAAALPSLSNQYFRGLNYLINEEQDKAINIFTKILEDNPETVDTHISLGSLFRRRGETARAISIHENLMNHSNLSNEQRLAAQMELGRDYMRAGLLDRAEVPFRELSNLPDYQLNALRFLNEIYDQEHDWDRAIEIAKNLKDLDPDSGWNIVIAHYYCEKADLALRNNEDQLVETYLQKSLDQFSGCVRANIIWARLFEKRSEFAEAVNKYKMVEHQNPSFLPEVVPRLVSAYEKIAEADEIIDFLQDLAAKHSSTTVLLTLVKKTNEQYGEQKAEKILLNSLQSKPSVQGLEYLISLTLGRIKNSDDKSILLGLQRMMLQLREEKSLYKCKVCGFQARQPHWQCPGCRNWGSINPTVGVYGE